MSKEEILKDALTPSMQSQIKYGGIPIEEQWILFKMNDDVYPFIDTAMQTYAEQEACGFNVWSRDEALYIGDDQWSYNDGFYTTSQLFKIYQNETGKNGFNT